MPRRQRRRRRGTAEYTGPSKTKLPFPINLIFNTRAFYMFFIVVMIASIAAVGLYSGQGSIPSNTPPLTEDEVAAEPTPSGMSFDAPATTIDPSRSYVATIKTDKGDIKIELATTAAPETTNSFAFLAGSGFYNNTVFFYVDKDYLTQAGDPTCRTGGESVCSGTGGPGYSLKLEALKVVAGPSRVGETFASRQDLYRELNPDKASPSLEEIDTWLRENGYLIEEVNNKREQWAVVAPTLGQGGEDVSGSQFRILLRDDQRANVQETVFGKVIEGQEILDGLSDLVPCSVVSVEPCDAGVDDALVIQDVIVEPKAA